VPAEQLLHGMPESLKVCVPEHFLNSAQQLKTEQVQHHSCIANAAAIVDHGTSAKLRPPMLLRYSHDIMHLSCS